MHQNSAFENLEAVASAFCLDGEPKEITPYGNGHINDTFLLLCRKGDP